jgi:hypothetical protein
MPQSRRTIKTPFTGHISADMKRLVLRLVTVRGYKYKKIREISGVSERTTMVKKKTVMVALQGLVTFNAGDSFLRVLSNDSPT